MNPFQTFARHRTRQVFPPCWKFRVVLLLSLVVFFLGFGLVLGLPFQEALMVPGIIRSEPAGQVTRSPMSGRIDQVFVRSWDQVHSGDLLLGFIQEGLDLELALLRESLTQVHQEQEQYTRLGVTIVQGGSNPFDPRTEVHVHQLYTHYLQEHQLLVQAVQAKQFELVQYQSLPPAMQKQAIVSGLGFELEALEGRVQSYVESFLLQISQRLEVLGENQRELHQGIERLLLERQSYRVTTEFSGQVILLGSLAPGDWVTQGQPLALVVPHQLTEIYLELPIPQHQRSRITLPSQVRFFAQDGSPRSRGLVLAELTKISDQPSSLAMADSEVPQFLARGSVGIDQYPWLIPGTTGVAWIQGSTIPLVSWILELLDLHFIQSSWWQRIRDRAQSRYSNPRKHRLTSFTPLEVI